MKPSTNSLISIAASIFLTTAVLHGCGGIAEESCPTCEEGKAEQTESATAVGQIWGTILDPEAEPLSHKEVILQQGASCRAVGFTDENGSYEISIGTTGKVSLGLFYDHVWVEAQVDALEQPKEYHFQIMRNPRNKYDYGFRRYFKEHQ